MEKRNPANGAASRRKRFAQQRNACPAWVDQAAINAIYEECARVTQETGVRHHVDHIVPIVNKTVCGLHVPWNLRIITAAQNYAKNNKLLETV